MSWIYAQNSGKLSSPLGTIEGIGYSGGGKGIYPDAVNNPEMESRVDIGPIPAGLYVRGRIIPWDSRLGQYVIELIPDEATRARIIAYGRDPDSFRMHGDSRTLPGLRAASDGCIIQSFDVRQAFGLSTDDQLQVVSGLEEGMEVA